MCLEICTERVILVPVTFAPFLIYTFICHQENLHAAEGDLCINFHKYCLHWLITR